MISVARFGVSGGRRLIAAWILIFLISFWIFFLPALVPDLRYLGPASHTLGSSNWQSEKLQYSDWTFWGSLVFYCFFIYSFYQVARDRLRILSFPKVPKALKEIDPEFL